MHRKFLNWEWYKDIPCKILALHYLLSANFEEKKWKGNIVKRGQLIIGLHSLCQDTCLSIQQIRTANKKLCECGFLNIQSTNKYSIITICNYDSYQHYEDSIQQKNNNQSTNEQQTNNNQTTTTKEIKNKRNKEIKNKKENNSNELLKKKDAAIAATLTRKEEFYKSLVPFLEKYNSGMIRSFFDYWSEMNKSQTKMRYEQQPTWELGKRLATWANKEKNYGKSNSSSGFGNKSASERKESVRNLADLAEGVLQGIAAEKFK